MALLIRSDLSSSELRAGARRLPSSRAAARALAIANALDGMTRAEAARFAGMERQALRYAVTRYNAEGLSGLEDRPKPGRPPGLTEGEEAALAVLILRGPDPERSGISSYTREDIALLIEQIGCGVRSQSSKPSAFLKKPRPTSRGHRCEVRLRRETSRDLADTVA